MFAVPIRLLAGLGLIALAPGAVAPQPAKPAKAAPNPCAYRPIPNDAGGNPELKSPDPVHSVDGVLRYTLKINYAEHEIAGCQVHLRNYNGKLVGDTLHVKPGDVLYIDLDNDLPQKDGGHSMAGMHDEPMSQDVTNLHTHGLHVSPSGKSDNVFLEVWPGEIEHYKIEIPKDQAPGTFWYHAHVHGSTSTQVSSGMEGAIVVEGGLDEVKGIKGITEHVLLLQQISYDEKGVIEDFSQNFGRGKWEKSLRRITINGQLVPVIHLRPGEIQRWRVIHGGVHENIALNYTGGALHEISTDGLSLGRSVGWTPAHPLMLSPGYRSDVLVKGVLPRGARTATYYLVDGALPATKTIEGEFEVATLRAAAAAAAKRSGKTLRALPSRAALFAKVAGKPEAILAKVIVGDDPVEMDMPTEAALAPTVPHRDIRPDELTGAPQTVTFNITNGICDHTGKCVTGCVPPAHGCALRFMVDSYTYTKDSPPRVLVLNTAAKWTLGSDAGAHPFHIHVNAFQVDRMEPDGKKHRIWKDTWYVDPDDGKTVILTRYEDFPGDFVLHCHILDHEDMGMMQKVSIREH